MMMMMMRRRRRRRRMVAVMSCDYGSCNAVTHRNSVGLLAC